MTDISMIKHLLDQKRMDRSFQLKWIPPETITGLNLDDIFKIRESDDGWTSETDLSEQVFNYFKECYRQGDSCLPKNSSMTLVELYVRAMVNLIIEYHSSLAAVSIPSDRITIEDARNCLPFFSNMLLDTDLDEYEVKTLQQYICDFYQYDDLWQPPEGKFHKELKDSENMLVDFLCTRSLRVESLKQFGVPDEIMPFVGGTKLIKKYLE
jgi:hypothetical protein